nr:hypothetical protein [Tanacetum cinerariifolium]
MVIDDKSWTLLGRHEREFYIGLEKFVNHCKLLVNSVEKIKCPCKSCRTILWVSIKHISDHITRHGFDLSYKTWVHHGEPALPPPPPVIDNTRQPQMSNMTALLNDLSYIPPNNEQNEPTQGDIGKTSNEPTQDTHKEFEELYPVPTRSCTPVVTIKGYKLPPSYYAIKKTFKTIRWKDSNTPRKKVPKKVLRYCSIIPRLQRLYKSSHTAKKMILHATGKCTELSKDIDVYLRPLIKDLKVLWDRKGVETIDVASGQKFNMRAMVLLTINDFPARSSLSRWSGQEALEGGHIRPLWMFPFERYRKKLKGYVRNKAKPEDLIVEGYVAEEALTFSSHYFRDVTTKFNRPDRNVDPPPPTHEIDINRSQFKSLFPNKDMKEEFPDWFGSQIRQRHLDNDKDLEVSTTSELFALACGPTWTPISINSCVVDGVRYVVHIRDECRTTQNSGICSPGPDGEMYYDGQSTEVDAPPDVIDVVDEDDDIIDDEDALPYDLANSDDEDLINVDDDGVDKMSTDVARSHGDDGGGEDRSQPHYVPSGYEGCFANRGKGKRKPNLGGRVAGRLNTRDKTWNLSLKEIMNTKDPVSIRFEVCDKQTLMPLCEHAAHWSSYIGEVIRGVLLYHPSWLKVLKERKAALIADIGEEIGRLEATGTYTDDEINRLARMGKQRGHIFDVGRVLPARATASPSTPAHESTLNSLHKKVDFMMSLFNCDSKYSDMFSHFESGGASGSGGCRDNEESANDQDDEDENGNGDT